MFGKKPKKEPLNFSHFTDPRKPVTEISSRNVVSCREDEKIIDVMNIMLKRFRRIPLVSNKGVFKGLVGITDVIDFLGGGSKYKIYKFQKRGLNLPVSYIANREILTLDSGHSAITALETFKKHGRGLYPVTAANRLKAVVTEWDIFEQVSRPENEGLWLSKGSFGLKVEDVMTPNPITIKPEYAVRDVVRMVCQGGFRRLPVTDNGIIVGIVTPYDLLFHLKKSAVSGDRKPGDSQAKDIMNKFVTTVEPEEDLYEAVRLMRDKKIGGLPVTEDEEIVGIITERDLVDALVLG
jgi:CBS domain-containing protein